MAMQAKAVHRQRRRGNPSGLSGRHKLANRQRRQVEVIQVGPHHQIVVVRNGPTTWPTGGMGPPLNPQHRAGIRPAKLSPAPNAYPAPPRFLFSSSPCSPVPTVCGPLVVQPQPLRPPFRWACASDQGRPAFPLLLFSSSPCSPCLRGGKSGNHHPKSPLTR